MAAFEVFKKILKKREKKLGIKIPDSVKKVNDETITMENIEGINIQKFLDEAQGLAEVKDYIKLEYTALVSRLEAFFKDSVIGVIHVESYYLPGAELPNLRVRMLNGNSKNPRIRLILKPDNIVITSDGFIWIDPH